MYQLNKPAAQIAGAEPSRCNSTSMQNPTIQKYRNFDALQDLESLTKFQYSLFFDWKSISKYLGVTAR